MRKVFYFSLALLLGTMITISCKKVEVNPSDGGGGQTPDLARTAQIIVSNLPGVAVPQAGLTALVSFTDSKGDTLIRNKRVALNYEQAYYTDTLHFEKGAFDLVKFWVMKDEQVLFVAPRAGSPKAQLVNTPIPLQVSLLVKEHKSQPIEVAKVGADDKAEDFGYKPGDFGKIDPGPVEDPNAVVDIFIHPKVTIGDVVYDSIPVSIRIQTFDAAGQLTSTAIRPFMPGKNKVGLLKSAAKHVFRLEKWGTVDEFHIMKHELLPNREFTIGGMAAPKKLTEVSSARIIEGVTKPEVRKLYQYNALGKLTEIQTFRKKADQTTYLHMKELVTYSGNRVENIKRYNESGDLAGATYFGYNGNGQITNMIDDNGADRTNAEVRYANGDSPREKQVGIMYDYSNYYYTTSYTMYLLGGSVIKTIKSSTNTAYEEGEYQYDFSINPYVHLGLPDIYLSNISKHNLTRQVKQYVKDYPLEEPYLYTYKYDNDGYPIELVVKYKTYLTGQHAYDLKTLFKYQ